MLAMRRKIIPYNPNLVQIARRLRNQATRAEKILWKRLSGRKVLGYDFHRQKPIDRYIIDFFCSELNLAVEIDGDSHYREKGIAKDLQRTQRLNELGIHLLRFNNHAVYENTDGFIDAIISWITTDRFIQSPAKAENAQQASEQNAESLE